MRAWLLTLMTVLGLVMSTGSAAQAAPPTVPANPSQTGRILSVRIGGEGKAPRVLVESDAPPNYHVFLPSAGTYRVVPPLPRVRWAINGRPSAS